MRQDVSLGEVARRAEALAELLEEREVDVHLAIARAIERADRGVRKAARRADRTGEQHYHRLLIGALDLLEQRVPGVLGVGQHRRRELLQLLLGRRAEPLGLVGGSRHRAALEQEARIHAEEDRDQRDHDQADPAYAPGAAGAAARHAHPAWYSHAARHTHPDGRTHAPPILDIRASSAQAPAHVPHSQPTSRPSAAWGGASRRGRAGRGRHTVRIERLG